MRLAARFVVATVSDAEPALGDDVAAEAEGKLRDLVNRKAGREIM